MDSYSKLGIGALIIGSAIVSGPSSGTCPFVPGSVVNKEDARDGPLCPRLSRLLKTARLAVKVTIPNPDYQLSSAYALQILAPTSCENTAVC
jgi:hypothetical protein